jgi:homoserine/homoserine lactone efflux protein
MRMDLWWLYATIIFLLSGTPGPNMLHVMSRGAQVGFRRSISAMLGCASAIVLYLVSSALGLGALLKAYPRIFDLMRYAGAAYLIWLGIKAWRSRSAMESDDGMAEISRATAPEIYRVALFVSLSNPKLIIFAAALFPQFIDPGLPFTPQLAALIATFIVIESGWYIVYAMGGQRLSRWLQDIRRQRLFDRLTGTIFVSFGCLLLSRRG